MSSIGASWFETRKGALLTMRNEQSPFRETPTRFLGEMRRDISDCNQPEKRR
jgi:hypothetical protein